MPPLVVIGADSSLRERLGAVSFSFQLRFASEVPRERRLAEAALVAFPEDACLVTRFPRRYPVIACGPVAYMEDAFARGAADYLPDPWSLGELRVRTERILGTGPLVIAGTEIGLDGLVLDGPGGEVVLPAEQAALLRQLILAGGMGLSRGLLRRFLWPALGERSRAVDITASRLRSRLEQVSGAGARVQLRAVRGFGYSLSVGDSVCETCG